MIFNSAKFKIALLSLSLLTIMAGAGVAPGIGKIVEAFPNASETMVKLVISLPPLLMIFSALLTGIIGQHVKSKTLIILGLVLFVLGGVGTGFVDSFCQLLFFRAILGFGTGIILPFSTGLIAACYKGNEKSKMMGYSFASNNLGAVVGNVLSGFLAAISWRYIFSIYWIGLIVLILVAFFLKKLPESSKSNKIKNNAKIPLSVFYIGLSAMAIMMIFYLVVTNMSLIIIERGIGTSRTVGYIFAVNTVTMLLAGMCLPLLMKLRKFFIPISFFLIAIGFMGIAEASMIPLMFTSVIISGAGIGFLFPYLLNLVSNRIHETQSIKAMSITMAFAWFGQFLSPLFFGLVSFLTGLGTAWMFLFTSIVFLTLSLCLAVVNFLKKS